MPGWTHHSLVLAGVHRLVRGPVILAVVDTIAHTRLRDAPVVGAGELSVRTLAIVTVQLVSPVTTVILMVALPGLEDTPTIATPVL